MSYKEFLIGLRRREAEKAGVTLAVRAVLDILAMVEEDTKGLALTSEDVRTILELVFKESPFSNMVRVSEGKPFCDVPHAVLGRRPGDFYCWAFIEPTVVVAWPDHTQNIIRVRWYKVIHRKGG